jgi:Ca-activated chloride channel homolog
MLSFAWWWIALVLPLPWLVRRYASAEPIERAAALRVPSAREFGDLGSGPLASRQVAGSLALLALIWCLAVVAAARPQWIGEPITVEVSGRDLLIAVDLSGSMEEQDFQLDGQWVDRLTAIKALASDFIARRAGDRIGLILFGREAYLQTPLTFDRATVTTLLNETAIGLAGRQTAIGDAIGLAIRTLEDAGIEDNRRVLVLLTDGANTAGSVEPLKAAELAAQRSMVIYPVGIGADAITVRTLFGLRQINPSTDLDEETLLATAAMTGGQYFRARDAEEFEAIYATLDLLEPAQSDEAGYRPVTELYYWPLALAALIAFGWALAGFAIPQLAHRVVAGGEAHG